MKRTFSIFLTFLFIIMGSSAHGEEKELQQGEYKLLAYTLSNSSPESYSKYKSSKSISFHSLYISSEAMDTVLNRDDSNPFANMNQNDYQGFAIRAAYAPTANITFHSSLGLTDTSKNRHIDYANRVGWEVDIGLAYKLFNNFAYEVHFGYMDTGELFQESRTYTDVDHITIVVNKLTMSF
ncbi:MAG: hypothetical protein U9R57_06615 [Thermodesulfobacteriota bacterium]|nr:hypothetical protein [Thermodesulfobacteriota bacterium]